MADYGYADIGKLADFANNTIGGLTANDIMRFPRADVQPVKHGRWENEYLDDDDVWWADCTNCKNDSHSRFGRVSLYAYCPKCGADMRGVENGSN